MQANSEENKTTAALPISTVSSNQTDYGSTTPNYTRRTNNQKILITVLNTEDSDDNKKIVESRFTRTTATATRIATTGETGTQFGYQNLTSSAILSETNFHTQRRSRRNEGFIKLSRSTRYGKMSDMKIFNNETGLGPVRRVEHILSILNHTCIGFITIYMSWLCLRAGLQGTALHAWLVTIGYSFLMAEGVMSHYSSNVLTSNCKRDNKTTLHWILQSLGGTIGMVGTLIKLFQKGFSLHSTHGKLGFATLFLCAFSMLSGLSALFSMRLKYRFSPLVNKSIHNYIGVATFVIAMITQFYGYKTGFFMRKTETDFQTLMKCLTLISLTLCCIGPLKALLTKTNSLVRQVSYNN